MFNIILYEPEIPPNTGNIMRLCANTGAQLHLVEPLGFELDDKRMRRAGLDYREWVSVKRYQDWNSCRDALRDQRVFALSTRASRSYADPKFEAGDCFLFGPETRDLPTAVMDSLGPEQCLRIPMLPDSRSLNLSNSVAVLLFEAWRQSDFSAGA